MANTQTSVPVFTAGQILTAEQQNQINTGIPVFASATTRNAAFGGTGEKTLAEGQFAYLEDSNTTQYYDGSSWLTLGAAKCGQVVQTFKSNTFTSTSTSYVDITDLSVTITPTSSSSKILVMSIVNGSGVSAQGAVALQLLRGATVIGSGDAAGSRTIAYVELDASSGSNRNSAGIYLDSPATTSATTYKIQGKMVAGSGTWTINRSPTDTDNVAYVRTSSTITVIEVLP